MEITIHWCFVFCLPISSQIKKSADSLLTRFFPKPRATVFLLCLFSLFIVVSASRILWELPDPQPKFYMTSQPTQLPLTVRWYWISVQAMGLHFFSSVQNTAIRVVACSTVFSGYWLTVVLICLKYLLWNCVIIFWGSFLFTYSTILFFIASSYIAHVFFKSGFLSVYQTEQDW